MLYGKTVTGLRYTYTKCRAVILTFITDEEDNNIEIRYDKRSVQGVWASKMELQITFEKD